MGSAAHATCLHQRAMSSGVAARAALKAAELDGATLLDMRQDQTLIALRFCMRDEGLAPRFLQNLGGATRGRGPKECGAISKSVPWGHCERVSWRHLSSGGHRSKFDARIKSLEAKVSAMDASFTARDAMRHLEWFISREAVLAHGVPVAKFKKRKLYNFQKLKEAEIPLPTWINEQMVTLILHFKEEGNVMVHPEINDEAAVRSAIEEEDDDTEDITIKTDMIYRLKNYYAGDNKPFGTKP